MRRLKVSPKAAPSLLKRQRHVEASLGGSTSCCVPSLGRKDKGDRVFVMSLISSIPASFAIPSPCIGHSAGAMACSMAASRTFCQGGASNTCLWMSRGGGSTKKKNNRPNPFTTTMNGLYTDFYKLPEPIRFMIAGLLGNFVFFLIDWHMYKYLLARKDLLPNLIANYLESASYGISYMMEIIVQHWLNAFCWYGMHTISTREKYFKTLAGTYSAYFVSIVLSTAINIVLIKGGMDKNLAFVATLAGSGLVNYLVLKWVVAMATASSNHGNKAAGVRGGGMNSSNVEWANLLQALWRMR